MELEATLPDISTIIRGADVFVPVKLLDENGDTVNLTSATEITAILPNADGITYLEKKLSTSGIILVNAGGGKFNVKVTNVESKLLQLGNEQGMDVRYVIATLETRVKLLSAVNIVDPCYPAAT